MTEANQRQGSLAAEAPYRNFRKVTRNGFREYFQPSRIVLGVLEAPQTNSGLNVITLCFSMHCSYKPRMLAVAIQNNSLSYHLLPQAGEMVLAVPGPTLLEETVYCGTRSGKYTDKIGDLNLKLEPGVGVKVPHLSDAIANVELKIESLLQTGDHVVSVGRVVNFLVNNQIREKPLVSIGPQTDGYDLLRRHGQHRIATVRFDNTVSGAF